MARKLVKAEMTADCVKRGSIGLETGY